jgi:hypothetical protein
MKIKRHIPNACEGIEPTTIEFNTKAELLNIPYYMNEIDELLEGIRKMLMGENHATE